MTPIPEPVGIPSQSLSPQSWVDARCRDVLGFVVPRVSDRLQPYGVRALLLGGSAALGEAVGWETANGQRWLLSDLDLTAITRDVVPPSVAKSLTTWLAMLTPPRPGPVVALGLVPMAHYPFTPPTPGMVDFGDAAWLLYGDARTWQTLPRVQTHRIPRWEALRLVGNRALELLQATLRRRESPTDEFLEVRELHALAKAATGLFTASLILDGAYEVGWQRRSARLWAPDARAPVEVLRLARTWDPFLRAPGQATRPSDDCMNAYRLALRAFLAEADRPFDSRFPVRGFLEEPCDRRDLVRAWRRGRRAWAQAHGSSGANGWICRMLARALSEGLAPGTPVGRALAAATLYWIYRPDLDLGEAESADWLHSSDCLLGVPIPPGRDVAGRLETAMLPLLTGTR